MATLSKEQLIRAFGASDFGSAKVALMNAGVRFEDDITEVISNLTSNGISIARIPELGTNILHTAAYQSENLRPLLEQPTFTEQDRQTQPTVRTTTAGSGASQPLPRHLYRLALQPYRVALSICPQEG